MTHSHISSTSQILEHAQLFGYRGSQDEPDPRPMPSDETITKAVEDIFDILSFAFWDSGLESDLNNVLWGTVNQFHHTAQRVARELDRNEQAQRSAQTNKTAARSNRSNSNASSPADAFRRPNPPTSLPTAPLQPPHNTTSWKTTASSSRSRHRSHPRVPRVRLSSS